MITNYTELKAAIANWLNRDDLTARIPEFIANGEARLNTRVRHRDMESSTALALDSSGQATLPTDFLEARYMSVASTPVARPEFVQPGSREWLYRFRPYATPQYYTTLADKIAVQPAFAGSATLYYYAKLLALGDGQATNWLLDRAPEAYLYAAVVEAWAYLQDTEEMDRAAGLLESSVDGLLKDDKVRKTSRIPTEPRPLAQKTTEPVQ